MVAVEIVVSGHVQGVGFRAFVRDLALHSHIRGEVWNRYDGCVVIRADHESERELHDFVDALWRGPGRVSRVEVTHVSEPIVRPDFVIGPSRP